LQAWDWVALQSARALLAISVAFTAMSMHCTRSLVAAWVQATVVVNSSRAMHILPAGRAAVARGEGRRQPKSLNCLSKYAEWALSERASSSGCLIRAHDMSEIPPVAAPPSTLTATFCEK
jgi:hypothetical protein